MGDVARARALRQAATPAERVLWRAIRSRVLESKVRRQVPRGPYILDFFFDAARLAVELDGETHATAAGQRHDARRDSWLANQGIRVLRVSNREVAGNLEGVLAVIAAALAEPVPELQPPPHPGPDITPQSGR